MSPVKPPLPNISVKERNRRDPDFLGCTNLSPDRHYVWVRRRADEHLMSVTRAKLDGYEIETLREGGPQPLAQTELGPDRAITVGDLVLMSCPKSIYDQRMEDNFRRNESLLAANAAQSEQMAKEKGISLIRDPDHS